MTRTRRNPISLLVLLVTAASVAAVLAALPAVAAVVGIQTIIATFDPDAAPVEAVAVGSDGTIYATVTDASQEDPFPPGRVRAFRPDGDVEDTAWSFSGETDGSSGYPMSLGVDADGDLYGHVIDYDPQAGTLSQEVWTLQSGASAPAPLPFALADIQPSRYSSDTDLAVSANGDVVVKDLADSSLWLLRAGETTPVPVPAPGMSTIRDLDGTPDGTLYALGSTVDGTGHITRLPAGSSTWEVLPVAAGDPAVARAVRIAVDDRGGVYALGPGDGATVLWHLPDGATSSQRVTTFASSSRYAEMATVGHEAVVVAPMTERTLVRVEVRPVNVVAHDTSQVVRTSSVRLHIDAHDLNGDPLAFEVTDGPDHGSLSGEYPEVTYTPDPGYRGRDSVTYKVTSPNGTSATATVTLDMRQSAAAVEGDGWTQTPIYATDGSGWAMTPTAVAVTDDGTVHYPVRVDESGGSVVAQASDGTTTPTPWRFDGNLIGYPIAMDADAAGNLYGLAVTGMGRYEARVLRAGAAQVEELPVGPILTNASTPPAIAVSADGDLVLTDWERRTVSVLDAGASEPRSLALPPGMAPYDVDVDRGGRVHVVGATLASGEWKASVFELGLDASDPLNTTIEGTWFGIGVADDGTAYLAGYGPSTPAYGIVRVGPGGVTENVSGRLSLYPSWNSIDVDRNGSVYVPEIWGDFLYRIDFELASSLTVSDSTRTVRAGTTAAVALSAVDTEDEQLTFEVTEGPEHGVLAGNAPAVTYTPEADYIGPDSLTYRVTTEDGDSGEATVTLDVVTDGAPAVGQTAAPGQTVATGLTPTEDEPTQAAVTTPVAGDVTIMEAPAADAPEGYALVGTSYQIEAPDASVDAPLSLQFRVAADQLPDGLDPDALEVFRDGVAVEECAGDTGRAEPDPCVASRTVSEGVITVTVLSSHASAWALAVGLLQTTTTVAPVAPSTYGETITLTATVAQAGPATPVGTVEFRDTSSTPAKVLGTSPVGSDGVARLPDVRLEVGDHRVVAAYSGSPTSLPNVSAPMTATVAKAPVLVTTKATAGLLGMLTLRVTYRTVVLSAVTGEAVAGATVTTRIDGAAASTGCSATTDDHGVAQCKAGPVNIALGGAYTATSAPTASYRAGTGKGRMPLL